MSMILISKNSKQTLDFSEADTTLVLVKDVSLTSTGDGIVAGGSATGRMIVVDGAVSAAQSAIVFGDPGAGDLDGSVIISATGSIEGTRNGLFATADGLEIVNRGSVQARLTGIAVSGAETRLTNEGTVISLVGNALDLSGDAAQVVNNSRLSGETDAVRLSGDQTVMTNNGEIGSSTANGIVASGLGTVLTNNGTIGTRGHGIFATGALEVITNNKSIGSGGSAIIAKGQATVVTNSGALNAGGDGIALYGDEGTVTNRKSIEVGGIGIRISADDAIVNNLGTVKGTSGIIVVGDDVRGANSGTVTSYRNVAVDYTNANHSSFNNSGVLVSSSGVAFNGGAGQQSLTNTGTIKGDVDLGGGADYFDGTGGTVFGHVAGGTGNDTYVISNPKTLLLEAKSGGSDLVIASATYTLAANFENLTLGGSRAIDATGNAAANQIHGNSGVNRIDGKAGNDLIWGHGGADILTGGAGVDQFVFATGDGRDTITDFTAKGKAHDVLDLSGLASITDFKDLIADHAKQVGGNVLIDAFDGDSILLKGVKIAHLDKGDFFF